MRPACVTIVYVSLRIEYLLSRNRLTSTIVFMFIIFRDPIASCFNIDCLKSVDWLIPSKSWRNLAAINNNWFLKWVRLKRTQFSADSWMDCLTDLFLFSCHIFSYDYNSSILCSCLFTATAVVQTVILFLYFAATVHGVSRSTALPAVTRQPNCSALEPTTEFTCI